MLTMLRIKNLALVADLTIELQPGLNVITGETGAGKSILIGGLNLVLGERADRTLIRGGADSCSVEAVFDVRTLRSPLSRWLDENGLEPCEEGQLVLKRTFTATGTNRQFINGSPTTLQTLGTLGEWLVDIHGPHDHQSLLHPSRQLAILDAFAQLTAASAAFGELVRRRTALFAQKAELIVDEKTYAQQLDLLRFQVQEISGARLVPGEEKELEEDFRRATNAARLIELAQAALGAIDGDEGGLLNQAGALGRTLHELQRLDASPAATAFAERHDAMQTALQDLQTQLSRYADRVEVDPARLQELADRLNVLQTLKRKYGSSLTDVIACGEEARLKLQSLESRDAELERIKTELTQIERKLVQAGRELSAQRRKSIPTLTKAVIKQLSALGFKQSQFDVQLKSATELPSGDGPISGTGLDLVEFQFAPNPGEPMRALRAIASSGEMARVMLAIKTVLAVEDEIPVLVFDEVDANVGGETAHAVGEKMRQIGQHRQVLCITHLAPVAAHADAHYEVSKQVRDGRTTTAIAALDPSGRVTELARMLGGQSAAARKHAEELLAR